MAHTTTTTCGETLFQETNDAEVLRAILNRDSYPKDCAPRRGLCIFNSCTKAVLLSYPYAYHDDDNDARLSALSRLIGNGFDTSCVQCSRQKTYTHNNSIGAIQPIDHIIIPYGHITFTISNDSSSSSSNSSHHHPQQHVAAQNSLVYPPNEMTVQQRPPLVHTSSDPSSNRLPRLQDITTLAQSCFIGRHGSSSPEVENEHGRSMMMIDDEMTTTSTIAASNHPQVKHRGDDIDEYYKQRVMGSGLCRPAISINADANDRELSLLSHKNASHPIRQRPFVPYARRNSTAITTTTSTSTRYSPPPSPQPHAAFRAGGNDGSSSPWNTMQQNQPPPRSPSSPSSIKHHSNNTTRRCISSPHIAAPPTKPMATVRRRHSSSAKTNFCTSRSQRYASSSSCAASVSQHHVNHCESCGTTSSPEWRKGPSGHKTYCNACGLRYWRSVARKEKMMAQQQKARNEQRAAHHNHYHQQQHQLSPISATITNSTPPSPSSSCSSSSPLSPASPAPIMVTANATASVAYADNNNRRYDTTSSSSTTTTTTNMHHPHLQPAWGLHPKITH
ncbi:hypothetical protein O0I10_000148 [Lichtheimia ornata]|uniref:GATA-type domain-containing protein n=1 Tax=Lichtheimia ornata TaxID=688661 RepID=A0AAD8DJM8_9FUNG|nr:uncharacterized protein O0I10_000148 [Lichtheimia ornata]KAJ8663873.1 hypothetical protein O0I10_000148 [Lichtheimia ornata]